MPLSERPRVATTRRERSDRRGDGDAAVLRDERRDPGDPIDVDLARLGVESEAPRQVLADLVAVEQGDPSRPRVGELVGQRARDRRLARAGQPGEEHHGARAVGPAERAQDLARRRGRVEGGHLGFDHRGHGPDHLVALRQVARQVDHLADAGLGQLGRALRRPRHDEADHRRSGVRRVDPVGEGPGRPRPAGPADVPRWVRSTPRPDDDHVGMDQPDREVREAVGRDGIDHERRHRSRAVAEALPHGVGGQAHLRVPLRTRPSGHRRQRPDGRRVVGGGPADDQRERRVLRVGQDQLLARRRRGQRRGRKPAAQHELEPVEPVVLQHGPGHPREVGGVGRLRG